MARTRISCPNCRQPVTADINQVFDVGVDPSAKQRFLSGAVNVIQCPNCGYQGSVATPLVYHDPDKELLLTFVPPEMGLPRDEQERVIGNLLNQVVNQLPPEKRKAYLLRPQSTLTMQGLVERVLESEGITREMIQAQQQRLSLIQRLLSTSAEDTREEIARQEDKLIDAEFFGLIRRLMDASVMAGDEQAATQLSELQQQLLPVTTFGRELQAESQEIQAAINDLQAIGKNLTQEKLLDLVVQAPNETRLSALVGLTRPAMDYGFFGMLSERIEKASGPERERLQQVREQLLEMTREIDQQVEARRKATWQLLENILKSDRPAEAMMQAIPAVDEYFLQAVNTAMENARKEGNLERIGKLQEVVIVIQQASSAPPEIQMIEELLEAPDDATMRQMLEERREEITPEFVETLGNVLAQVQGGEDQELAQRLSQLNRMVLRISMENNLRK